jgi:hypothetical protein
VQSKEIGSVCFDAFEVDSEAVLHLRGASAPCKHLFRMPIVDRDMTRHRLFVDAVELSRIFPAAVTIMVVLLF